MINFFVILQGFWSLALKLKIPQQRPLRIKLFYFMALSTLIIVQIYFLSPLYVKSYCIYEILELYPPLAYSITGLIYMMQSIEILTIKEKTGIE